MKNDNDNNKMCDHIRGETEPLHEFQDRVLDCDLCKGWGAEEATYLRDNGLQDWEE